MSFIRRHGTKSGVSLPRDDVPESLRVGLVNLLEQHRYNANFLSMQALQQTICRALRRRPRYADDPFVEIEWTVNSCTWDEFYQICETIVAAIPAEVPLTLGDPIVRGLAGPRFVANLTFNEFVDALNELLSDEGAPWRMSENHVVPTFPEEIEIALEDASQAADHLEGQGVRAHLKKARQHLSPTAGDLENAVKEAVSAVEAAVKEKAGVDDFDKGLKVLKQQRRLKRHWAEAVQAIFEYASREDQIRHGSPELSELTYEGARDLVGLAAILTQHIVNLPDPVQAR